MDELERQRVIHEQRSEVATRITEQLGETEEEPRKTIYQIVKKLGVDEALHFMQRTLEVENAGGIMVPDQSRRRTTGGVFFYLIKTEAPPEITKHIFHKKLPIKHAKPDKEQVAKAPEVAPPPPPFTWADRIAVLAEITSKERGEVRSVKITLIGRPGRIVRAWTVHHHGDATADDQATSNAQRPAHPGTGPDRAYLVCGLHRRQTMEKSGRGNQGPGGRVDRRGHPTARQEVAQYCCCVCLKCHHKKAPGSPATNTTIETDNPAIRGTTGRDGSSCRDHFPTSPPFLWPTSYGVSELSIPVVPAVLVPKKRWGGD